MTAIPTPGSELRHVRKTVTFTGAANNGQLDSPITVFSLTGRVMVERATMFSPTALVGTALGFVDLAVLPPGFATAIYDVTADQFSTDNMWSPGVLNTTKVEVGVTFIPNKNFVKDPLVLSANLVLVPSDTGGGADVTGGVIIIDAWYRPITDDGALAGDDIDSQLVDAIWDEAQSGHTTAGTFGRYLDSQLATIASYIDTEIAAIKAKTDSLTFTVAGIVDSNVVDWKGSAAPANTGDAFARLGAPAGASVSADIATVATYVDTEVAAIKAVTDNLPNNGALSTIQSDLDDLQTRLPAALVGGRMDSSVGAMAAAVITAAAIATDAIDADALAADAVTEIWAKAMSELATVPAVNGTVLQALEWIFLLARNKLTQTATTQTLRNDADNANLSTSTVSDDGTTFTRGEWS